MISKELLKKVHQIQIRTSKTVNDLFAGQYHSAFRGRGMEFEEVRVYQVGDDVRSIDWNVSARYGHPYVKVYREERELTVMLLVDVSPSGFFGGRDVFKLDYAAELCAVLALSAVRTQDKVGLILFSNEVEKYVPPKKGGRHVPRIIRELLYFTPQGRGTNVPEALQFLGRVTRRKCVAFLVSDFLTQGFEPALRIARRRHDLVPIVVRDPLERGLPRAGLVRLHDAETGEEVEVDGGSGRVREAFERRMREREAGLRSMFRRMKLDAVELTTGRPYIEPLARYFRKRGLRA